MADGDGKKGEVRFTVSTNLWTYLGWLTENTVLGKTEKEVAKQLLTQRLTEMREESYKDKSEDT